MPNRTDDLRLEIKVKSGMRELIRQWAMALNEEITAMEETLERIEIQAGNGKGKK